MRAALQWFSRFFVVWVVLFAVAAWAVPRVFSPLAAWIVPGLALIMFGMGMTLEAADFARVARMPRAVVCGVAAQFGVMPALGWLLATAFRLPPDLAMGFIILGSCPGGTASNVITYLAKADVALSVTMTACSTLLAVVATPALVELFGGKFLPVDGWAMFVSVVQVVLLPVCAGLVARKLMGRRADAVADVFPALSVLVIVLVIAAIVASSGDSLPRLLGPVGLIAVAHNLMGMGLGYGIAWAARLPVDARRTIAIEVAMQNSGLGVALARKHFESVLVALPATLFSVIHNLTGSAVAAWWSRRAAGRNKRREILAPDFSDGAH